MHIENKDTLVSSPIFFPSVLDKYYFRQLLISKLEKTFNVVGLEVITSGTIKPNSNQVELFLPWNEHSEVLLKSMIDYVSKFVETLETAIVTFE